MAKKKMTANELVSIIDNHISSGSTYSSKITEDRTKALKYYDATQFGNEKKGRATYVAPEVLETISWALPQIIKVFEQNDGIVKFDPIGPESVKDAELATEYCEYVFRKQNNGFHVLYNFIFDALLQKNGVVQVYYDATKEYSREEFEGLNDFEVAGILQQEGVEPVERETTEVEGIDPMTGMSTVTRQHNIVIKRVKNAGRGKIKVENIPPEELIVSKQTRSLNLDESPFVARKVKKTISWLRSQGYKVEDDISDAEDDTQSQETITRNASDGNYSENYDDITDPAMRLVTVVIAYVQVDYDGDGIAEWRKVIKVGKEILDNEECYIQPFISTSPLPMPHKFYGKSLADLVMDLQLLKSMVMRAMLDSFAFNINPAKAVNVNNLVDINDLLNTNPGHWIKFRGDTNNAIYSLPSSGVGAEAFSLLDYIDNAAESRSGISRYTQGIDTNAFNKTATGTQAIMNASQEKLALITRIFAETGLAEIYKKILKISSMFIKGEQLIQAGSVFVSVDPKKWMNLETLTVNVGTGALDKQAALAQSQQILGMQTQLLQAGRPDLMAMVDAEKIFNAGAHMLQSMGKKNVFDYFNDPKSPQYAQNMQIMMQSQQPPPPDPLVVTAQIQAQTAQKKAEQDAMLKSAEFELDVNSQEKEYELKRMELELKYQVELEKLKQKDREQKFEMLEKGIGSVADLDGVQEFVSQNVLNEIRDVGYEQQKINEALMTALHDLGGGMNSIARHISSPKQVIKDDEGNIVGIQNFNID